MLTSRMMGQIGNQMFIYCLSKILADKFGLAYNPPRDFVDKKGRPVKWHNGEPLFRMEVTHGEAYGGVSQVVKCENWFDIRTLQKGRPIDIQHCYAQSWAMMKPYHDKIKNEWMKLLKPFVETDDEAVYVHCRLTDYLPEQGHIPGRNGRATTLQEYRECLAQFPNAKRLIVCTDSPRDDKLQEFNQLSIPWTVSGRSWDEDFRLLASCKNLLIAQSTYSWWAGLLGRAEKIVCPLHKDTIWSFGMNNPTRWPALFVDDEPGRWIWVKEQVNG